MATASVEISDPSSRVLDSSLSASVEAVSSTTASFAGIVREGLSRNPKQLPPWLFYDEAGSLLFEEITRVPEYYLTRLERGIFREYAAEMIDAAAEGRRLRIVELGAGSADKTRLILAAAAKRQGELEYCPVDVSESALEAARERLEQEMPEVSVMPLVADYTRGLTLDPCEAGERRVVLFIGSSIGNFLPEDALELLAGVRASLAPGDGLLLGVDLAPGVSTDGKSEQDLMAAYDDAAGVTARFNGNLLTRLNRELGADFDLEAFRHRAVWNAAESRVEMHLESLREQTVRMKALGAEFQFSAGETIHTENSYKYLRGEVQDLLSAAGFDPVERWMDADGWFAVYLASAS